MIAFGSIVPELTINIISCLILSKGHNLLGLSTIVGSGCFGNLYSDLTICLGISAFVASYKYSYLNFSLKSTALDYLLYLSCLTLITIIVIDNRVTSIEATFMLFLTPCYIFFNFYFRKNSLFSFSKSSTDIPNLPSPSTFHASKLIKSPIIYFYDLLVPVYSGKLWQIIYSFIAIIITGFFITKSTILVMERILCHIPISESLLGLTIIAWGNNIGDIMNSAVAAKRGNAQLAVSAVLATQILNMIFSLGFPWAVSTILYGDLPVGDVTTINSMYFAMGIVCLSFLCLIAGQMQLKLIVGILLSCLYVFYVAMEWTVLNEEIE